jgi:DNA-binding transcriptional LysR family regulator
MTDLRDMQLLAALARHRHFARAAEECGISQPAFSARIRNLETRFEVPIVKRGNRFMGVTTEGEIVLKWARQLLSDAEGLSQDIQAAKGALSGRLVIGAVPTAITFASTSAQRLRARHPELVVELYSATSSEVWRGLEEFTLDAGITYFEAELPKSLETEVLYEERYVLLVPKDLAPRKKGTATWKEAAALPLCLLTRNMRNRRILDETFAEVGAEPNLVMETDAFTAALTQVELGAAATIAPQSMAESLPFASQLVQLPLTDPVVAKPICLAVADRKPAPAAVMALSEVLRSQKA